MSCRALRRGPEREADGVFGDAPGWAGRSNSCIEQYPEKPCDIAALRHECEAGFAFSCFLLSQTKPPDDVLQARFVPLARAGCDALIENDCILLSNSQATISFDQRYSGVTPADRQLYSDRMCFLHLYACEWLASSYRERGELLRARDALEQACQYGSHDSPQTCLYLGEYYVSGALPEPVQGRGEALLKWACEPELMRQRMPTCKARATQHPTPSARSR